MSCRAQLSLVATDSLGKFWAGVGAVLLSVELYFLTQWVAGPNWMPVPSGPDVPPEWMQRVAFWVQLVSVVGMLALFYGYVVRPWRRERRIPTDGYLYIALLLASPWDTLSGYVQTWYTYNSYLLNYGTVIGELPGILSYRAPGANEAWSILAIPFIYGSAFLLMTILGCALIHTAKSRWPRMGIFSTIAMCIAFTLLMDVVIEAYLFLPLGLYSIPGGHLLINAGKYYQYSLWEGIFVSFTFTACILLRYHTNDAGETVAERGLSKLSSPNGVKSLLRGLGIIGIVHVFFLVFYHLPVAVSIGTNSAEWPQDIQARSYFTNGICGPQANRACAGPDTPIYRPGAPYLDYQGHLVKPE